MNFLLKRLYGRQDNRPAGTMLPSAAVPETLDERRANIIKWWTYYHGADSATDRTQWTYLYERFETMLRREIEDVETTPVSAPTVSGGSSSIHGGGSNSMMTRQGRRSRTFSTATAGRISLI